MHDLWSYESTISQVQAAPSSPELDVPLVFPLNSVGLCLTAIGLWLKLVSLGSNSGAVCSCLLGLRFIVAGVASILVGPWILFRSSVTEVGRSLNNLDCSSGWSLIHQMHDLTAAIDPVIQ